MFHPVQPAHTRHVNVRNNTTERLAPTRSNIVLRGGVSIGAISERNSDSSSATRNDYSSWITAISRSFATRHPCPELDRKTSGRKVSHAPAMLRNNTRVLYFVAVGDEHISLRKDQSSRRSQRNTLFGNIDQENQTAGSDGSYGRPIRRLPPC